MISFIKKSLVWLLQVALLITLAIPVHAASVGDSVIDPDAMCSIIIDYKEDVEGADPVVGAEFTFYRVALLNDFGGYESVIVGVDEFSEDMDVDGLSRLTQHEYSENPNEDMAAYIAVTNEIGQAQATVKQGLYVVVETMPVQDHAASLPRLITVPSTRENNTWSYEVVVEPKSQPLGYLGINKTVTGQRGEKDRDWHFVVLFENFNSEVPYEKTDINGNVTTARMSTGDVLTLKHGEEIMISSIPVGTAYEVTELEADTDGYNTTVTGRIGHVTRKDAQKASFVNKNDTPPTGDTYMWLIFAGIGVIALVLIAILVILLKRNKKEE